MNHKTTGRLYFAAATVACAALMPLPAAAEFPEKPITIIYPWAPGDASETLLRVLGEMAQKDLGQPLVISHVQGAGGKKALLATATSAPDGYTMVNTWVAPHVAGKLFDPDLAYDNNSFIPIAGIAALPFTLTVKADHTSNSIPEFVAWATAEGKTLNYGVCAPQSVPRLVGEQLMRVLKVPFNSIPNPTGCMGDNMTGLLNGSLDAAVGIVPATVILEGQVKHLGLIADEPHAAAPDLPTAKSAGYVIGWGGNALGWGGLAVPAGTPDNVVKRLQDAVGRVVQSDEYLEKLGKLKTMVKYVPPAEFGKQWEASMEILAPHVEKLKSAN